MHLPPALSLEQYQRHPYPPVPWYGLPLSGSKQFFPASQLNPGARILVVGCGTLEALAIGRVFPQASEIVAVDWSETALEILRKRILFYRSMQFLWRSRPALPAIRIICGDLEKMFQPGFQQQKILGSFDLIFASHVLHHLVEPIKVLKGLACLLNEEGLLRVATYPRASRLWMRQTAQFFKSLGLTAQTKKLHTQCLKAVYQLPVDHPLRVTFLAHPERDETSGLLDSFFHPLENPLHPFEWAKHCFENHLELIHEEQEAHSQSVFLKTIVPALNSLNRWTSLQILDDLLELCVNPILWFRQNKQLNVCEMPKELQGLIASPRNAFLSVKEEWACNTARIKGVLSSFDVSFDQLIHAFHQKVGPREFPDALMKKKGIPKTVKGLALSDGLFLERSF